MIISPGRGYVFVHIPKTGGTSLSLALEARAMKEDILIGDTPKARKRKGRLKHLSPAGRLWKHATLADIDGVLSAEDLDRMYCFTLVRNPWDRLVSYYHWLKEQSFDHPAVGLAKELPFDTFLRHPSTVAAFSRATAAHYMTDAAGRERCDAYIRIEHFETDAKELCTRLGFEIVLPRQNASQRAADYRLYYSDSLAEFVATLCAPDVNRFKYTF